MFPARQTCASTGTPCRLDRKTIDVAGLELQPGDDPPPMFRWTRTPQRPPLPQLPCWVTYTNERTHALIREGLPRSPLYRKDIQGTGPRYCPSIEDKIVRFADKDRHQIYLEPEGSTPPRSIRTASRPRCRTTSSSRSCARSPASSAPR